MIKLIHGVLYGQFNPILLQRFDTLNNWIRAINLEVAGDVKMEYADYIKQGLNGAAPLKLILCGNVQGMAPNKVGVVSVVYATEDRTLAEQMVQELSSENPNNYYMVYNIPLDTDLTALAHYPSIGITKNDLR